MRSLSHWWMPKTIKKELEDHVRAVESQQSLTEEEKEEVLSKKAGQARMRRLNGVAVVEPSMDERVRNLEVSMKKLIESERVRIRQIEVIVGGGAGRLSRSNSDIRRGHSM